MFATSIVPNSPTVVLITNLPVFIIAVLTSPCKTLLGIVIRFDKFLTALLVPFWIGSGNFLYPLATGSNNNLSAKLLKLKIARFKGSKGS